MIYHPAMNQPSLDQVLAAIGGLMLRWGFLETELLARLDAAGAPPLPARSPLQRWHQAGDRLPECLTALTPEIERVAQTRNLIAHGLAGAQSHPSPEVRCRNQAGASVVMTLVELVEAAEAIDRLRLAIRRAD